MKLTKKLLQTTLLSTMILIFAACSAKTIEPKDIEKPHEINIQGTLYIPEFKGLDPYYLSEKELVRGNEENWYIHNKKLYIFESEESKEKWFSQISSINTLALTYWELINKPSEEEEFEDMTNAFMNGTAN